MNWVNKNLVKSLYIICAVCIFNYVAFLLFAQSQSSVDSGKLSAESNNVQINTNIEIMTTLEPEIIYKTEIQEEIITEFAATISPETSSASDLTSKNDLPLLKDPFHNTSETQEGRRQSSYFKKINSKHNQQCQDLPKSVPIPTTRPNCGGHEDYGLAA